ncbi:hypothetical protein J2W88_002994 [Acidovorax delafieldii]|uniref:Uncharacterized protein n=1 Tax=Acidovorax delafieldii TaxID=47920 RepID=A0AAJ2BXG7_ACIDE|nr:hypothetical protein [Acidovorax delafieldii]MDR6767713.1 hypothetical protein [Acidovorax delafieldii]MDR6839695.1 hypothetical protein [Acidovorax delafieldii]MDR7368404.1 hypothetical protein [Acidovorax delafieldii]
MSTFNTKPVGVQGVMIPKGVEISVWSDGEWRPIGKTLSHVRPALRRDRSRTVWGLKRGRRASRK